MKATKDFPFKEFPFEKSRRIKKSEVLAARAAIEKITGKKRKARSASRRTTKVVYVSTSIRFHPQVVKWAKKEAKKKGLGYQKFINNVLLKKSV